MSPIASAPRDDDSASAGSWSRAPIRSNDEQGTGESRNLAPKNSRIGSSSNREWVPRGSYSRNKRVDGSTFLPNEDLDWNQLDMLPRKPTSAADGNSDGDQPYRTSHSQYSSRPYLPNRSSRGPHSSSSSADLRFPVGRMRNARFNNTALGDMDLFFLGTASCVPGFSRGVSATLLRRSGDCWLFDCGEGTQIQVQASGVKVSKISKVFITHMHGDHVFGLAGILCLMGRSSVEEGSTDPSDTVDIYGPEGLREYIRSAMRLSVSRITQPYRVHELMLSPRRSEGEAPSSSPSAGKIEYAFGERPGGLEIYPDENGVYNLVGSAEGDHSEVRAAIVPHPVTCFGFSIQEKPRLGTLLIDKLEEIVERNKEELRKTYGKAYRRIYQDLKALPLTESYTFPDGTVVRSEDFNSPEIKGRKVVILGDTYDASSMLPLSMDADAVVHEATRAWALDSRERFSSYRELEADARNKGHSTPQIAGKFARMARAKQLILTHFSSRFLGDSSERSMRIMWAIEDQARQEFGESDWRKNPNQIVAAWDFMSLPIPQNL